VGETLDEDAFFDGQALGVGGAEDAKQRIQAIRDNKNHAWHKPEHPGHAAAMKEMDDLYKLAFGTAKAGPQR
jgi:hypothetical protein